MKTKTKTKPLARDLQGKELLARRFPGELTVTFFSESTGILVRSVKKDEVWDDEEEFVLQGKGLSEMLLEAVRDRMGEKDGS